MKNQNENTQPQQTPPTPPTQPTQETAPGVVIDVARVRDGQAAPFVLPPVAPTSGQATPEQMQHAAHFAQRLVMDARGLPFDQKKVFIQMCRAHGFNEMAAQVEGRVYEKSRIPRIGEIRSRVVTVDHLLLIGGVGLGIWAFWELAALLGRQFGWYNMPSAFGKADAAVPAAAGAPASVTPMKAAKVG